MAITGDLWRITYSGSINNLERFAFGQYWSIPTGFTGTVAASAGESWLTAFLASAASSVPAPSTILGAFTSIVHWDTIHAGPINLATGDQLGPGTTIVTNHTGAGGNGLPFQTSHCVTLLADVNPGLRRRRNRFYLPPYINALFVPNTDKILSAFIPQLNAAVVAGQTAAATATPGCALAVYSRTDHQAFDAIQIYTGDVLDTQRRRRRSLIETRTTTAI